MRWRGGEKLSNSIRMKVIAMKFILLALGSVLFIAFFASISMAQVQRTFVSGGGSDSNPCSRAAPCRTFTQALKGTSAGGEVVVLDSAGYGTFAVTQAVSITAPPGVYAGISVFSGDGIDINAGSMDTVILRGLAINNQGSQGSGIVFYAGGTLHIEGCVINGFANNTDSAAGVIFGAATRLEVKDSTIRGNNFGIDLHPVSGSAHVTIDRVLLEGNSQYGLIGEEGSIVSVRNSVATGNGVGFYCFSNTSASAEMNIENCVASNNFNFGIGTNSISTGSVTLRVSNSTVTNNLHFGLENQSNSAMFLSRGNNTVQGNLVANMDGPIGSYSAK
jgi:hypothetical protein